ncbi:flagellar hook-length control protein FliK [Phaeobacter sp. 22II1-1F12B]|uniref:flagellar hook-length control protein FliK n=1 Tax=Phaeobacter sp. 22II1-1F12B TaxID=1317111 RepID=UPI001303DCEA|nr:flagellar hook-length control protein FliK [Phaeobacter sp. 22II1-1F12B]
MLSTLSSITSLSGLVTANASKTNAATSQTSTEGAAAMGFAALLARLGASTASQDSNSGGTALTLPGDSAQRELALKDLSDDLDALAAWMMAQSRTQQNGVTTEPGNAGTGLDLGKLAEKLNTLLSEFDKAYGANTREVLLKNAAMLPEVALPENSAKAGQAFLGMARVLIGLEPSTAQTPPAANTVAAGAQPVELRNSAASKGASDQAQQAVTQATTQTTGETRAPVTFQELLNLRPAETQQIQPSSPTPSGTSNSPAPQQQPQVSGFAANLVGQIKGTQIAEGTTRVELSPRGLGGIEIDLSRDDEGTLKVTVRAENPSVMGALRDNREALLLALRDSGVSLENNSLGFEDFGQGNRKTNEPSEQISIAIGETEEEAATPEAVSAAVGEGRVDIIT